MRLWSLHPSFLDAKGLVALWRETLLAQNVLYGKTKAYVNHPQLKRFHSCVSPKKAIQIYLTDVQDEAVRRGYNFDKSKILDSVEAIPEMLIDVTEGQLDFELQHLVKKLAIRDKEHLQKVQKMSLKPHPLFHVIQGNVEDWELVHS